MEMSPAERKARVNLALDADLVMFDGDLVRELLNDIELLREVATEDISKWGFDALVTMATRMLDEVYPESVFTGESGDTGPRFVVALRAVIKEIEARG
jgi:hypothetical protein